MLALVRYFCRIRIKFLPYLVAIIFLLVYFLTSRNRHEMENHTQCPHSWIKFGPNCFKLVKRVTTFLEAAKLCAAQGAHLPIVKDEATQKFLVNYPIPEPLMFSQKSIDKIHASQIEDPEKFRSFYEHAHHVKMIWLSIKPILLSDSPKQFLWSDDTLVEFSNFKHEDPTKDLYDIGLPYVAGMTIVVDEDEDEETRLKQLGKWEFFIDLNVCGHCLAAICQKNVTKVIEIPDDLSS